MSMGISVDIKISHVKNRLHFKRIEPNLITFTDMVKKMQLCKLNAIYEHTRPIS